MAIDLSHIGEPLVARMLETIATRRDLNRVRCAASGLSLAEDFGDALPEFIPDRAHLRMHADAGEFACDGAQTVDVLAAVGDKATAFELKLGLARMTPAAFQERFCSQCDMSEHSDLRLTGSMVALLDRRVSFPFSHISAIDCERTWLLTEHWWLIVRRQVFRSWNRKSPVSNARILVFEDIAATYGGADEFDRLVIETIKNGYAIRWGIFEE